jgi:hypothetical protein
MRGEIYGWDIFGRASQRRQGWRDASIALGNGNSARQQPRSSSETPNQPSVFKGHTDMISCLVVIKRYKFAAS